MIDRSDRPLTEAETQILRDRLEAARRESRLALIKTGGASAAVCLVLAVATLLVSNAPWWVVSPFWLVMAAVFTLWIGLPWHRLMRHQVRALTDAVTTNRAIVTHLQASRVIEFEEEEDEGACYAFEHGPNTWTFVVGQEFYEDDDFPNTDFSIVDVLGSSGQPVTSLLVKTGLALAPARVIPAAVKRGLHLPEHLQSVHSSLETIETTLRTVAD